MLKLPDFHDPRVWRVLTQHADELDAELPPYPGDDLAVLALVLVRRLQQRLDSPHVVSDAQILVSHVAECYAEHTRGRAKPTATVRRAAVPRRVSARAGRKDHG